jgi:glutamine cyclotransferase
VNLVGALALPALLWLLFPVGAWAAAPVSGYTVVATFHHNTANYTEGFLYADGLFYEGTGIEGRSRIVASDPRTGTEVRSHAISPELFGEGIVDWGSLLYEWTWRTGSGFVYDRATFRLIRRFTYTGEGWGMTHNDREIITSDGTATLRFRNPQTFAETRHLVVTDSGRPVQELNELEWVRGEIYANVWHSDRIARISPKTGVVIGWIDLSGIVSVTMKPSDPEAVLNGIAYDAQRDRLFVTGKEWPLIYEIKVAPEIKVKAVKVTDIKVAPKPVR